MSIIIILEMRVMVPKPMINAEHNHGANLISVETLSLLCIIHFTGQSNKWPVRRGMNRLLGTDSENLGYQLFSGVFCKW